MIGLHLGRDGDRSSLWFDDRAATCCWMIGHFSEASELLRVLVAAKCQLDEMAECGKWQPPADELEFARRVGIADWLPCDEAIIV